MSIDPPRRQRLTRAEAKAQTRRLLLESAAQTFARKGFAGASVDEIAESAGFSIGALYSNFANKEDLFLELAASYNTDRIAAAEKVLTEGGDDSEELATKVGRILVEAADDHSEFTMLQAEFWLYAVRNPHMLGAMAEHMRQPRSTLERLVDDALARQHTPPGATAQSVATLVAALFEGLVRQRRIDPDQVPEELFGLALKWLFAGIAADGAQRPASEKAAPAKVSRRRSPRRG